MKKSLVLVMFLFSACVTASNDLDLYDNQGNAVVYISLDDELTLYSWEGEPSAYLKHNQNNEFDVYGFNGNHLGWFTNGMLIDHDGYVACAVKDMVTTPNLPSLKSLKSLKPLKSLTELPPLFPLLKNAFGQTNCSLLVASGVA
ncbi:TPA: hypothetical protein IBL02_003648 [Escherichia coli]|mgnify:FL=1|jgi:hypothetical protein|nr:MULTISPECIES: hypothetical protein [Enterobacteriaceae]EAB6350640.1 hypothetical protein [Salmonella enterica subsp. enterica serovar Newport]EBV0315281.1 hypothetical protein [Salmonella enterica subsp. enterica serovar Poona]EDR2715377.1 hypothetical protein [Salmonella enterica subsp. enterica]EFA8746850.1 hypothetical protein [Escherichia coli O117]HAK8917175.1 hypothetical protein [Salmonella enterica]